MTSFNYNQILGLSVTGESGKSLGKVTDLVLDYETGKFLALFIEGQKVIKSEQIKNVDKDQILVSHEVEGALPSDKIQKMIQSKIKIKGNKVITESGTHLGKVVNFEIDLNLNRLSFIFVKDKLLGKSMDIAWDQIISIKKEAILVKDEVVKIKAPELELAGI